MEEATQCPVLRFKEGEVVFYHHQVYKGKNIKDLVVCNTISSFINELEAHEPITKLTIDVRNFPHFFDFYLNFHTLFPSFMQGYPLAQNEANEQLIKEVKQYFANHATLDFLKIKRCLKDDTVNITIGNCTFKNLRMHN